MHGYHLWGSYMAFLYDCHVVRLSCLVFIYDFHVRFSYIITLYNFHIYALLPTKRRYMNAEIVRGLAKFVWVVSPNINIWCLTKDMF
jgi:hypothetical protein